MADLDDDGVPDVSMLDAGYLLYFRTLLRLGLCLAPALLAWVIHRRTAKPYPVLPVALFSAWLWPACHLRLRLQWPAPSHGQQHRRRTLRHFLRLGIGLIALLFALPPVAVWLYSLGSLLDRYVTRSFLRPSCSASAASSRSGSSPTWPTTAAISPPAT